MPVEQGFTIAIYVIGIMIASGGILLGLGYAINEKRFKDFGKNEIWQAVVNSALVGFVFLSVSPAGFITPIINSASGNNITMNCPGSVAQNVAICLAYNYMIGNGYTLSGVYHNSILSSATEFLVGLYSLNGILGAIAAVKINLAVLTISFNPIISPVMAEIQYIIKMLNAVIIGAVVQGALILFISASAMTVIFPTGIVLRTFYPTRRLGGFFIALAIGLYAVYPLSYVFNAYIANSYKANISPGNLTEVGSSANQVEGQVFAYNSLVGNSIVGTVSTMTITAVQQVYQNVNKLLSAILYEIGYFIVYTFILPAFSLIITGISVREFARVLGSEANFGKFNVI